MTLASRRDNAVVALLCALFVTTAMACGPGDPSDGASGSMTFELRAAEAVNIASVAYVISGNGFNKSGTINVTHSTVISASIGGIPSGVGYTITLTAMDVSGAGLSCSGSATFSIIAGMTTLTNVHLTCHVAPRTGSVLVNGTLNICPSIDSIGASPAETTVGHELSLSSVGSDLDLVPSALTYAWTSTTGTIAGASSADATFTCTAVGSANVVLTVSDGDCSDTVTITVTCSMGDVVAMDASTPEPDASMPPPALIVINEVESSGGVPGDWVEIYNAGGQSADLSGYVFKDADDTHAYVIPNGTTLAPAARMVLDEATFAFGLGAADSARLFDASATLVDSHAWTAHATVTYGRCPDGTGAFTTTTLASKGAVNDCGGMGAILFDPWPTNDTVIASDVAGTFGANLSDLAYQPANGGDSAVLWAVQNNPSRLYHLTASGATWSPSAGAWTSGKQLRYPNGLGSPDAEGVTQAELSSSAIYVAAERDNDQSSVSRLSVLRFDVSAPGTELVATHEWNLTTEFAAVGPNLGLEAIAWVPDAFLLANGFYDDHAGHAYDPASYAGHGSGVFFVALEGGGSLYAYALDHATGAAQRVATVASGMPAVMAVSFDRDVGYLWTHCDEACGNRSTALAVDTSVGSASLGRFIVRGELERPTTLGNNGHEGMAFASESTCVGGVKNVFFADDGQTGGHALRTGTVPCGAFL
jgi:hypothetical protein